MAKCKARGCRGCTEKCPTRSEAPPAWEASQFISSYPCEWVCSYLQARKRPFSCERLPSRPTSALSTPGPSRPFRAGAAGNMAVDTSLLQPVELRSFPPLATGRAIGGKGLAWTLLGRKRNIGQLEPSEGASSSSQQSQQTLLEGDSPCSSTGYARSLPSAGRCGHGRSALCTREGTPVEPAAPHAKRQRRSGSAFAAATEQCVSQALHDARNHQLPVSAPDLSALLAPACSQPAELQQHLRAQQMGRQSSWPYFVSPYCLRDPGTGMPVTLSGSTHSVNAQPANSLPCGSFVTPAGHQAPAADPVAPQLGQSAFQSGIVAEAAPAPAVDSLLQDILLQAFSNASADCSRAAHQTQALLQSWHLQPGLQNGIPYHSSVAVACQTLPDSRSCPTASHPAADPAAFRLPAASFHTAFKQRSSQASTAQYMQADWRQQPRDLSPHQSAPLQPEQRAQLHSLCDHLLSKTLSASNSAECSPARQQNFRILAHKGAQAVPTRLQQPCMPQWPYAPPAAIGPTAFVMQWSCRLALQHTDSIFFSLHLWSRIRDKVLGRTNVQRKGLLAACLWIATKHEECRRGIPPASRIAAAAGMTAAHMNVLELSVLSIVDWCPLSGWDDGTHSKGQLVSPHDPVGRINLEQEIFYL